MNLSIISAPLEILFSFCTHFRRYTIVLPSSLPLLTYMTSNDMFNLNTFLFSAAVLSLYERQEKRKMWLALLAPPSTDVTNNRSVEPNCTLCTETNTFTLSGRSVDGWHWSLLWQRVPHILLFHVLCPIVFFAFSPLWYCAQFLWDDSKIECVCVLCANRYVAERKGNRFWVKSPYTVRLRLGAFLFEFKKGQGQFQYKQQFDPCPSQIDCCQPNVEICTSKRRIDFTFVQYASGDGNRSTLRKIEFFVANQLCWVEPVACDNHRQSRKTGKFHFFS